MDQGRTSHESVLVQRREQPSEKQSHFPQHLLANRFVQQTVQHRIDGGGRVVDHVGYPRQFSRIASAYEVTRHNNDITQPAHEEHAYK